MHIFQILGLGLGLMGLLSFTTAAVTVGLKNTVFDTAVKASFFFVVASAICFAIDFVFKL